MISSRALGRAAGALAGAALLALGLTATAEATPTAAPNSPSASCQSGELCLWSGENFSGVKKAYSACRTITNPYSTTSHGSVIDNQTGGVATVFYYKTGGSSTVHPVYEAIDFDFTQYSKIKIC